MKYDQAGDSNYSAAPQVDRIVNAQKANQTISVTRHAPASAAYSSSFGVAATAPGGAVIFSSAAPARTPRHTFTITSGSGTCTVKYDQAGNANYNAAPQVTESTTAQKANQTIVVTLHAPATKVFNTSFSVAATGGGSGNAVTFSSSGVCTNSGDTFTMTSGTGTCSVNYDQAGDANYNAASQVTESVTAQKAAQTITFAPLPDRTYGDPDFTVSATSDSGLAVSFGATGSCTVSGTTVHLTGPGSCTVTASQPGNGNYSAAADVPRTFQVNAPADNVARLTGKDATCTQVTGGTAATLSSAQYVDKNGVIKKAIPNLVVYWVKVHLSAGSHTVEVDQAITSGNFTQKLTLANGSKAFTAACGKVKQPTFTNGPGGSVTAGLNAAATGDYWIAVRYQASAINGQATPAPTTIHFLFSTAGVAGSSATLDLLRQVSARPAFGSAAAPVRLGTSLAGLDRFGGQPRQRGQHDVGLRQRLVAGREVAVREREHPHACGPGGADAIVRVLDRGGVGGLDAQPARGLEVDVGRRLAAADLLRRDGRGEQVLDPEQAQRQVDQLAVRGRGQPERPAGGEPLDRLPGAGERRQVLAVGRGQPLDHFTVDLLGCRRQADRLVHVTRPLVRAHAHHVPLRGVVPAAAALPGQLLARLIPDLFRVEQHAVEVEDDGLDHRAA